MFCYSSFPCTCILKSLIFDALCLLAQTTLVQYLKCAQKCRESSAGVSLHMPSASSELCWNATENFALCFHDAVSWGQVKEHKQWSVKGWSTRLDYIYKEEEVLGFFSQTCERCSGNREGRKAMCCDAVLSLSSSAIFLNFFFLHTLSSDTRNVSLCSLEKQFSSFVHCFIMCQAKCTI